MREWVYRVRQRRGVLIGLCVLLCGCILVVSVSEQSALQASAEITNWGLGFSAEGQPPTGNASAEYLEQFGAVYYDASAQAQSEKRLYLTFDAGYENGNTEKILEVLQSHGVSATFFLVGNYLETQPELVRRMVAEGHTVGNHTYSHPDMSAIADLASFQAELKKNEQLYEEVTGETMAPLYRPPQGKFCESNLKMAQELGYHTVFWSLAYVDWYENNQPTREEAFEKLLPRIHAGAVVLLHSTSKTNAAILDELLTQWENGGYTFGKLTQLFSTPETDPVEKIEWVTAE